jgi:hypothetical protein
MRWVEFRLERPQSLSQREMVGLNGSIWLSEKMATDLSLKETQTDTSGWGTHEPHYLSRTAKTFPSSKFS